MPRPSWWLKQHRSNRKGGGAKGHDREESAKLTALLHHITPQALEGAYYALKQDAAPGEDAVTWREYGEGLEERIRSLHWRVHTGGYRATPSRRVNIPKPDGGTRPLGVASVEDKIVQKAVLERLLEPIYEAEFIGFSYGFRPGRGAHDALDALACGIQRRKVNWIVDADIKGFFDSIDREQMLRLSSLCAGRVGRAGMAAARGARRYDHSCDTRTTMWWGLRAETTPGGSSRN